MGIYIAPKIGRPPANHVWFSWIWTCCGACAAFKSQTTEKKAHMIKQNAHALAVLYIVFFSLPVISDSSAGEKANPKGLQNKNVFRRPTRTFSTCMFFFTVKSYDTIAVARARFDQKTYQMLGCKNNELKCGLELFAS